VQSTIGKYYTITVYQLSDLYTLVFRFTRVGDIMCWFDSVGSGLRVAEDCTLHDKGSPAVAMLQSARLQGVYQ